MSSIVTTDSSADLSPALLQELSVEQIPLTIILGGTPRQDGLEINPEDIFQHVSQGGDTPTTSAISIGEYQALFSRLSPQYDTVIHINIGSGFSSCHASAKVAAGDFDNVYVVDSRSLSTGQGAVVLEACRLVKEGVPAPEIAQRLEKFSNEIVFSFILDQLTYLRKGGRCSGVVALGANLLQLKPVITLKDNALGVGKKYRGGFEKILPNYLKDQIKGHPSLDPQGVYLVSAGCSQAVVDLAVQEITSLTGYPPCGIFTAGCTIFSHCGPNTLGLALLRKTQ